MRIKRAILIPAILALGASGSALAASAVTAATTAAPSASVVAMAPNTWYQG
jgi:hypothetical protein